MQSQKLEKVIFCVVSAFLQGICLVTIPASSFIYKSQNYHQITNHQYGATFLPQIIFVVLVTLWIPRLFGKVSKQKIFLAGLLFNVLDLVCVALTKQTIGQPVPTFVLLLFANTFLGIGFGCLVSMLNLAAVDLFPGKEDISLVSIHAMIGLGASSGPWFIQGFYRAGDWSWSAKITTVVLLGVFAMSLIRKLQIVSENEESTVSPSPRQKMPRGLVLFFVAILIYGIIESIMGNWTTLFVHDEKGLSAHNASVCLSLFWACLTLGRVLSAFFSVKVNVKWIYRLSPCLMFFGIALAVTVVEAKMAYISFALIGLGASVFFPLSLGEAVVHYQAFKERIATFGLAMLMVGVGIGSFCVGIFRQVHLITLTQGFMAAGVCALILIFVSFSLTSK